MSYQLIKDPLSDCENCKGNSYSAFIELFMLNDLLWNVIPMTCKYSYVL